MMTHHSPVAYDPAAVCRDGEQFIDGSPVAMPSMRPFCNVIVGCWITSRTDEQLLFFLHEGGCNGRNCLHVGHPSSCWESSVGRISSNVLLVQPQRQYWSKPSHQKLVDAVCRWSPTELPEGPYG